MLSRIPCASTNHDNSQVVGVLRSHLWNVALLGDYMHVKTGRMLSELRAQGVSKVSSQLVVPSGVSCAVFEKRRVRV